MAKQRARRSSPLYMPSAWSLFKPSRDLFMNNINVFAPLYVLPLILWLHSWISIPAHGGNYWQRLSDANFAWPTVPTTYLGIFIGFSIIWLIFTLIAGTLVQVMLQKAQLELSKDKHVELDQLWQYAKTNWLELLKLYIVLAVIIGIGFALLIVPGLILMRRYFFAPYVMIDKKCGIKEALEGSHAISNRNTGAVWGLIGVLFVISLIGILPIIGSLASFVLGALYSIAPAMRYQQLKNLA